MMPSKSLMTLLGPGARDQKESKKGRAWWTHNLSWQGHSIVEVITAADAAVVIIVVVVVRENAEREGERERDWRKRDEICKGSRREN